MGEVMNRLLLKISWKRSEVIGVISFRLFSSNVAFDKICGNCNT